MTTSGLSKSDVSWLKEASGLMVSEVYGSLPTDLQKVIAPAAREFAICTLKSQLVRPDVQ
jgi:hypothetical protein